ncbi:CU044_5270 family protein [Streptomyces vastus]|uniref:CU044_5270 family protein n=1 Tax=Streptomyces vastus TaxID=285451 RepID=A0ABP6DA43_9ACTN
MNAVSQQQPERHERAEREELARLLPAADTSGLTPDRHRLLKGHVMNEIDFDAPSAAGAARRSRKRLVFVLAPTAAACALALSVALGGIDALTGGRDTAGPGSVATQPVASPAAVELLNRIALTANEQPGTQVRDNQYTYVKIVGFATALNGETGATERTDEAREEWTSVDGTGRTLQQQDGEEFWLDAPGGGTPNSPTYRLLEGLPTDPTALLKEIYEDADLNHGSGTDSTLGADQAAFVAIGDMLRYSAAPPASSAALYRAAARIPGVTTRPDAVDAAGRHGVAVTRTHDGERNEWIFDKGTLRLLGTRTVLVEDSDWGKAGTAVESVAITATGIVDKPGRTPAEASERHA